MTRPHLSLEVDLSQQDTIYFLPLGKRSSSQGERFKLAVRLRITHNDPAHQTLTIKAIRFSFPGSDTEAKDMVGVPDHNMDPADGKLTIGKTANWFNGTVIVEGQDDQHNQIYRDQPAPQQLRIAISCAETTEPYVQTFTLLRRDDPTGQGALLLPFIKSELADDEYVVTSASHHYNGPPRGTQIFAHDISIQARRNGDWSRARVSNPTKNEDIRSFGRPVRGMATGTVHNVILGKVINGIFVEYWDNPYGDKNRDDDHYGSITVWVDYGALRVGYMHLRQGSVLVKPGEAVWPGRKIAESGNSGNTKGKPHLHMECRTTTGGKLCGMTFKKAWMIDRDLIPADGTAGPRVHLDMRGIAEGKAALRPFATEFGPETGKFDRAELEAISAEVFGGASKGGDGFVVINGKLKRVPPRGIRGALLDALVAYDDANEVAGPANARMRSELATQLEKLASDLRSG